jgi:hypothetical protein
LFLFRPVRKFARQNIVIYQADQRNGCDLLCGDPAPE